MKTLIVLATVASVINPFYDDQPTHRVIAQISLQPLGLFLPPVEPFTGVSVAKTGDHVVRVLASCMSEGPVAVSGSGGSGGGRQS
jgi:hypothetical protein